MTDCLIVGAGIAGLMAAQQLQTHGRTCLVLDKGRGLGGRMATRRLADGATADHGAQFFTVRSPTFHHWVSRWLANGVAAEWSRGFPPHNPADGHPRYRGQNGMTDIPKWLAQTISVRTQTEITAVQQTPTGWQLITADGQTFAAPTLLLTPPVPQSLALLAQSNLALPPQTSSALSRLQYDPCFAVMATLRQPSRIPTPGAVQLRGEPISWIADNQQKGISAVPAVTIHASPTFTRHWFDEPQTAVAQHLIHAAHQAGWLDKAQVADVQVRRWRYAQPSTQHPERCVLVQRPWPLAFAGDAFQEARVEGAALSGLAAANALLPHLP